MLDIYTRVRYTISYKLPIHQRVDLIDLSIPRRENSPLQEICILDRPCIGNARIYFLDEISYVRAINHVWGG